MRNCCNNCFWLFSGNECKYHGSRVPDDELEEGCTDWRDEIEYCAGHTFTIGKGGELTITPTDKSDERYLSRRKT